jgi:hypothetical protein
MMKYLLRGLNAGLGGSGDNIGDAKFALNFAVP